MGRARRPWTIPEVERLRDAYTRLTSALKIWQSGAFPGRSVMAINSALQAHGIHRPRRAPTGDLIRSSTMLTRAQIRWLERRYGASRRSEGLRELVNAAMAAENARPRADQGGAVGVAGQRPAAPLRVGA